MLEEFTGINIKGANFEEETQLQFFNDCEKPALGLIYGKNGSGKSTISRGFSYVRGNYEESILDCKLIGENGNEIEISSEDKQKIHVFNEDYIDKNIRIEEDALGTIVVLGKRADLDDLIKEAEKKEKLKKEEYDKQNSILENLINPASEASLENISKEIQSLLKGESNWAGRDAKIKGNSRASVVKTDAYKVFINIKPKLKRDELVVQFNDRLKALEEARKGSKKIDHEVKLDFTVSFDEKNYLELLSKKIQKCSY